MASVSLITVVHGESYERYAEQLFESALEHLNINTQMVVLPGVAGWPAATLYRYHVILEHYTKLSGDYLFLCDADMRFEAPVGEEILSGGIVATRHPGYIGQRHLPYEQRRESAAFVGNGNTYYAGGFVGGQRAAFLALAQRIKLSIDRDDKRGIMARWHDESHLNSDLAMSPPTLTLSPAYCHPDNNVPYLKIWPEPYERRLVALDKTPRERGTR